jgi:hypothetical protein
MLIATGNSGARGNAGFITCVGLARTRSAGPAGRQSTLPRRSQRAPNGRPLQAQTDVIEASSMTTLDTREGFPAFLDKCFFGVLRAEFAAEVPSRGGAPRL